MTGDGDDMENESKFTTATTVELYVEKTIKPGH